MARTGRCDPLRSIFVDPVLPAFDGASVAGLVPALFGRVDNAWIPEPARAAPAVVLLVLDGLGWSAVQDHASRHAAARADGGERDHHGRAVDHGDRAHVDRDRSRARPARHRRLPHADRRRRCSTCCAGRSRGAAARPIRSTCSATPPFLDREVPVVTRTEFRDTGFTQAHLRGGRLAGWHTVSGLVEQCVRAVEAGERFVYAYYPGVDTIAHEFGLHDRVFTRELGFVDRFVGELIDALPARRRAARHVGSRAGAPRSGVVDRDTRAPAVDYGGGRRRPLPLPLRRRGQPQGAARARARAVSRTGRGCGRAPSCSRWACYGAGATGTIPGRIGSVVLAAREAVAFVDPALPNERTLLSGHGSLTPDEMYVPLLAARGNG